MTRNEIGLIVLLSGTTVTIASTWFLARVVKIPWFAARFESGNRALNAQGMLPVGIPVYLAMGVIMLAVAP